MTTTFPQTSSSAQFAVFQNLLARYVTGQVAEPVWNRVMRALDARKANQDERIALAAFVQDAALEFGAQAVNVPKPDEVESLLAEIRY